MQNKVKERYKGTDNNVHADFECLMEEEETEATQSEQTSCFRKLSLTFKYPFHNLVARFTHTFYNWYTHFDSASQPKQKKIP